MPEFFYLLINYPALIVLPLGVLVALSVWSASRTAWAASVAWLLYLLYEFGMKFEILCTGTRCLPRGEMYVVYPLLAFITLVALVQVYVHWRDRQRPPRTFGR